MSITPGIPIVCQGSSILPQEPKRTEIPLMGGTVIPVYPTKIHQPPHVSPPREPQSQSPRSVRNMQIARTAQLNLARDEKTAQRDIFSRRED